MRKTDHLNTDALIRLEQDADSGKFPRIHTIQYWGEIAVTHINWRNRGTAVPVLELLGGDESRVELFDQSLVSGLEVKRLSKGIEENLQNDQ